MACGQALPHADNFFSGEAPPSRRWHRRHRESQSLPLEWNQIQGELRQQRASFDRRANRRSEEHTSELQSRLHLVCRLLLEKKKQKKKPTPRSKCTPHVRSSYANSYL